MKQNLYFILFSDIEKTNPLYEAYYNLLLRLSKDYKLTVFCLKKRGGESNFIIKEYDNLRRRLFFRIIKFFFTKKRERLLKESLFDSWISKKINNSINLIFFDRPLYLKTLTSAKKNNTKIVTIASVPHPFTNYCYVLNESLKYNINTNSTYTDIKRSKRIANILQKVDKIFILSKDKNNFYYQSYSNFIDRDKLQNINSYFKPDDISFLRRGIKRNKSYFTIVHLSHINLIKGVQYLLEAWTKVDLENKKKSRLIIAGRIDKDVKEIIATRYNNLINIEYTGWLDNMEKLYKEADLFISPSISDAGPQTIIEFLSRGIPVLASNHCGASVLIQNGVNGYVYNYNNVNELASAITKAMRNQLKLKKGVKNSLKNLSNDNFVLELEKYIINLLSENIN